MANHKLLAPFILSWEGGWANDPVDQGGQTMKGIILDTYKTYCRIKNRPEPTGADLRNISQNEWDEIFKTMYWDRWKADQIQNQSVANILVDWVWASGSYGITIPQRILGVVADGIVGAKTLAALNGENQKELFDKIKQARLDFVDDIVRRKPSQKRFIVGWKRRINAIKFEG